MLTCKTIAERVTLLLHSGEPDKDNRLTKQLQRRARFDGKHRSNAGMQVLIGKSLQSMASTAGISHAMYKLNSHGVTAYYYNPDTARNSQADAIQ